MTIPSVYDESQIEAFLAGLSRNGRILFAVACAEWLFASYEEFATRTGLGDKPELRSALDIAWGLACGNEVSVERVEQARLSAESLVPSDDSDNWSILSPIAQNATAGAAYALRAWTSGSTQEAVWSCRQLHEAADYIVQVSSPSVSYSAANEPDSVVSMAVDGILRSLELASGSAHDVARFDAEAGGLRLRDRWASTVELDE